MEACSVVPALFQLLHELEAVRSNASGDDDFQLRLINIQVFVKNILCMHLLVLQETALTTLKSLCTGKLQLHAKQQIVCVDAHKRMLLKLLRELHFGLLRRTLLVSLKQPSTFGIPSLFQLLHQLAATTDTQLRMQLRFSVSAAGPIQQMPPLLQCSEQLASPPGTTTIEQHRCSFASQLMELFEQFCKMLPNCTELCRQCMDTLCAMCRDSQLLEEAKHLLKP